MSDVADDIVDGTVCIDCGSLFEDPDDKGVAYTHGYPVACKKCFQQGGYIKSGVRSDGAQRAIVNTF